MSKQELRKAMGHGWLAGQLARFKAYREAWPLWWIMWALLGLTFGAYLLSLKGY